MASLKIQEVHNLIIIVIFSFRIIRIGVYFEAVVRLAQHRDTFLVVFSLYLAILVDNRRGIGIFTWVTIVLRIEIWVSWAFGFRRWYQNTHFCCFRYPVCYLSINRIISDATARWSNIISTKRYVNKKTWYEKFEIAKKDSYFTFNTS